MQSGQHWRVPGQGWTVQWTVISPSSRIDGDLRIVTLNDRTGQDSHRAARDLRALIWSQAALTPACRRWTADGLHSELWRPERIIRLPQASYDLLLQEANRRGVEPDALADELVRTDLAASTSDLQSALVGLAELRAELSDIDGVAFAREARTELEHRGA